MLNEHWNVDYEQFGNMIPWHTEVTLNQIKAELDRRKQIKKANAKYLVILIIAPFAKLFKYVF